MSLLSVSSGSKKRGGGHEMTQRNIQADLTPYLCSQVFVSVTTLSSRMQHGIKTVRRWE